MPTAETPTGPIHYEITDLTPRWVDAPETVIFHHGVGIDMDIWSDWLPIVATDFRCVRLDMRGFGRSHIPPKEFPWSMDQLRDDLLTVADAVGAERFHLIGESIGGTVSLYTALHAGDRVHSITALSTGHRGNYIRRVADWRSFVEANGIEAWSDEMMQHRFHRGAVPEEVYDWFAEVQGRSNADAILNLGELLMRQDLSADLPGITCPVLLIHPDSSPFLPVSMSAEIHSLLPNAEMMVIPHAKHGIACSHATEAAFAFLDFVSQRVV